MVSQQIMYAFNWASWSSIFAGAVTAMALWMIMSILGVALGFTVIHPKSDEPLAGLGKAFGLWASVSVIVSMAGGGFIAGLFAGQRGMEHGFLVWALVAIAAMCFWKMVFISTAQTVGSAVKGIGSGAAGVASSMGKGAAHAASNAISELKDSVSLNLDSEKLTDNVTSVLRDTGIENLHPDHLHQQMREARSDLRNVVHQLSMKPTDYEQILAQFIEKEKSRLEALTQGIDKEAAVNALMKVRNIPQEEAQTVVDNAVTVYNQAVDKAKESLAEANAQVEDAKVQLAEMAEHARDKADKVASTFAKVALGAAVALILAAMISMGAGAWGANCSTSWYKVQSTYFIR